MLCEVVEEKREYKIVEKRVCDLCVDMSTFSLTNWETIRKWNPRWITPEPESRHCKLGDLLRNKLGWRVLLYLEMHYVIVVKHHSQISLNSVYKNLRTIPNKIIYAAGVSLLQVIFYRMVWTWNNNVHMNTYPEVYPQIVTRQLVPSHFEKETFRQHFVSRDDRTDRFEASLALIL
jgi:hypothetical protein